MLFADRPCAAHARQGAHLKDEMKNAIIDSLNYARSHGTDRTELADWVWPE